MLYGILAFVIAVIVVIAFLVFLQRSQNRFSYKYSYRRNYLNLINRVEVLTYKLNQMQGYLPIVNDPKLMNEYESCIQRFENLLSLFKNIDPHGTSVHTLSSAHFLIKDCEERVTRINTAFRSSIFSGKKVKLKKPVSQDSRVPIACYFCSKPFIYTGFSRVKVRLEDEVKQVYCCDECKHILKKQGSVKVLYFVKNGVSKHWSELPEYNPIRDYGEVKKNRQKSFKTNYPFSVTNPKASLNHLW